MASFEYPGRPKGYCDAILCVGTRNSIYHWENSTYLVWRSDASVIPAPERGNSTETWLIRFIFRKWCIIPNSLPNLAASGCLNFNFFGVPCTLFLSLAHELPYCFRHPSLSQYRTSFMETFICFAGSELIPYFVVQKPLAARRFPSCLIIVSKTSSSVSYCCTALVLNEVANERCHEVE